MPNKKMEIELLGEGGSGTEVDALRARLTATTMEELAKLNLQGGSQIQIGDLQQIDEIREHLNLGGNGGFILGMVIRNP